MKLPYNMIMKISTLTIFSYRPFTEDELNYLKALSYSVDQFNQISSDKSIF